MPRKKKEEIEEAVIVETTEAEASDEVAVEASAADEAAKAEDAAIEAEAEESVAEAASAKVEKPKTARKAAPKAAKKAEPEVPSEAKKMGKRAEKVGIVSSDKMMKTVVVRVDRLVKHPVYRKYVKRRKKFMAHDEIGAKIGDKVRIVETRPLSARKRWRVVEIIHRAES